ncbi:MAG: PTS sugar transporter subunit IIA [Leptotrichiaceae bacterium]|nr:PTS sugar transporter subunit IIA [Leptotrichiaceae bacterium]
MFTKEDIYLDIDAKDYLYLFKKMAKIFKRKKYVKDSYLEALIAREKIYPTGFEFDGYNIALPHIDSEHVLEQKIVLVRLKDEIQYREVVTNKKILVKIFIMMLVKNPEEQVEVLGKLIEIINRKDFYNLVINAKYIDDLEKICI